MRILAAELLLLSFLLPAQNTPPPDSAAATRLILRLSQLMESTAASIPDLQVSTATLVAAAKKTAESLAKDRGNGPLTAEFLRRVRAFLAVSDAIGKPYTLPETAVRQFVELRAGYESLESYLDALIAAKERQIRNPDPNNSRFYADENSRLPAPSVSSRVVFLGDSITASWHLNEYFTGRDFINRAIGGQVTIQMLGRMKADVIDLHPRAVLILAGINDISRGTPLPMIENNLWMMSQLARTSNIKVLMASVLPVTAQLPELPIPTIQELNTWIQNLCQSGSCVYVDYFSVMLDGSGHLPPELANDGLHPNSQGYRIMAPIALSAIDQALGAQPSAPARHRKFRIGK